MHALKWDLETRRAIVPVTLGGDGRCKALALLGDRLLDIVLYELLIKSGHTDEGIMTQNRSMCVANKNLALCARQLLVPVILSETEFSSLSEHEKGTLIEAFVGAAYERESYVLTPAVRKYITDILDTLRANVSCAETESSEFINEKSIKKAKSALLELLQKRGITNGITFFTMENYGANITLPPFVSVFEPSVPLEYCGLPNTGAIRGDECDNKKEAEENCARKVLAFFRSVEKRIRSNGSMTYAANVIGGSSLTSAGSSKLQCLEDGEEIDLDDIEKKRHRDGELLYEETRLLKERVSQRKATRAKRYFESRKLKHMILFKKNKMDIKKKWSPIAFPVEFRNFQSDGGNQDRTLADSSNDISEGGKEQSQDLQETML